MGHVHDAAVSKTILSELLRIPDVNRDTTGVQIRSILKARRTLALIFHALNRAYDQEVFAVHPDEWRLDRPIDHVPRVTVIDCHTHYFDSRSEWPKTHPAEQYQQGAHGSWWFFPEAYDFRGTIANWVAPVRIDPPPELHTVAFLRSHVFQTYHALAGRFRFFLTPAPFQGSAQNPLDGELDTASFSDMKAVCSRINDDLGDVIGVPFGVIRNGGNPVLSEPGRNQGGPTVFPDPGCNQACLWKLYPSGDSWNNPKNPVQTDAFFNSLPKALASLRGEHTVCIHWWDDRGATSGREAASAGNLGAIAQEFPNIRFVVYHSCFPNFAQFRDMLATPNIFAEIGGVFANMILGGDGQDGITSADRHGGPDRARQMIQTLRGTITNGRGEYDDKIVWGTDAIWHGSPFWQVEAFKRMRLSEGPQTPKELAFKRKVLGGNAKQAFPVAYALVA